MDWTLIIERLHLPLSLLMLGLFCAIAAWAYAPSRRAIQDQCAQIPMRDDDR